MREVELVEGDTFAVSEQFSAIQISTVSSDICQVAKISQLNFEFSALEIGEKCRRHNV